jgi:hypothetical protein
MKCPICGSKRCYQIECPEKKEGCCVFHFRCPDCEKEKLIDNDKH